MKKLLTISLILLSFTALADINDCLLDAKSFLKAEAPVTPAANCVDLLKAQANKIEATSADGNYKVYALEHMLYVEVYAAGVFSHRTLLAGDQTELEDIKALHIDTERNRLLVLQDGLSGTELLSFQLDVIGNVSPKTMLKGNVANGATAASFNADGTEVALTFSALGKIRYFSSEADSRYKDHHAKFNPVILRESSIP